MKRKLLVFFVFPFLLGSCTAQPLPGMELSRRLIVEAIGIDASPVGVTLTLETIDPAAQHTDTDKEKKWITYSFTAGSVAEAATMAAQRTGKTPFFAYAGIMLFGKDIAEKGLSPYLDFFLRNRTVRNTVNVCVAADSAASILNTENTTSVSPASTIKNTILEGKETGQCAAAAFFQFVNRILSPDTEAYCPLIRSADPEADAPASVSCSDTAVFAGDRFLFSLGSSETHAFLLLTNAMQNGLFRAAFGETAIDYRLLQTKTIFRTNSKNSQTEICVRLRARAAIVQMNGVSFLPISETDRTNAKHALEAALVRSLERCLYIIYTEHGTDLLRIRKRNGVSFAVGPDTLQFIISAEITCT